MFEVRLAFVVKFALLESKPDLFITIESSFFVKFKGEFAPLFIEN
jgi:hypothetical protein